MTKVGILLGSLRKESFSKKLAEKTEAQIKDNLSCLEFELTEEQMNNLNEISQIQLGFPHDMFANGQMFMYGNTFSLTDNHRK